MRTAQILVLLATTSSSVAAQPCITCRTEQCPDKAGAIAWCGVGRDPLGAPAARPHPSDQFVAGISIDTMPAGATVRLDGERGENLGTTPLRNVRLPSGAHILYFLRDGFVPAREEVQIRKRGQTVLVTLVQAATLDVSSTAAGAQVFLDGVSIGVTPLRVSGLPPGAHVVEVHAPGREPHRETVNLDPGRVASLRAELRIPGPAPLPLPPPPDQAPCPPGQLATVDTAGRCCWPGQAWNGTRCIGVPTSCPRDLTLDAAGERCAVAACPDGQQLAQDGRHCCWPGQVWASGRNTCVGVPQCPSGFDLRAELGVTGAEQCIERPVFTRVVESDAEQCSDATRPKAYLCDIRGYFFRGRVDQTAEEVASLRAAFRSAGLVICRERGAAARCLAGRELNASRCYWCCP